MKSAGRILKPFLLVAVPIIAAGWIIFNWWGILEFFSILSTFVLLIVCLPLGTAAALSIFWILKKRFALHILKLPGSKKRLGVSLFLTLAVVLSGAVHELIGYRLASIVYSVKEDSLVAISSAQNVVVLLMVLLILVDIVFTVSVLLEWASSPWKKRVIFLAGCIVFTTLVNVSMIRLGLFDSFWYEKVSTMRGTISAPADNVALFDFNSGWPGKKEFFTMLSILEKERPRAIVLLFPLRLHLDMDSLTMLELSKIVPVNRLVIDAEQGVRYLEGSLKAEKTLTPDPLREERMPMYIRIVPWRHSLGDDFAVASLKAFTGREVQVHVEDVEIGSYRIPMNWDRKMLIKYYATAFAEWGERNYPCTILQYSQSYIWRMSGHKTCKVNFDKSRLESTPLVERGTPPNVYYDYDSTRTEIVGLPEVRDKVLIVNVASQLTGLFSAQQPWKSPAYVYTMAIQNILAGDYLVETTLGQSLLLSLLILTLLWYSYGRWGAWWGLVATIGTGIVLSILLLVVFSNFDIFIGPASVAVPLVASLVSFFPYEIVTDRRRILEEQTRLTTELRAAREMQMGLMPKEDPIVPGFDIAGICIPANEVGGDFFDYVWLDEKKTRLGISVADVSGKAMRAAITAVMTSGMIYQEVGNGESPKKLLRKINKPLYMKIDDRMFTALSFGVLDTKKKELRFSNAGQAYPVLKRGKEVTPLEVKGARLPLGVKEDVQYGEMVVKLKKEDTVIFYTDGIPEAKNEKDEFYGFDRFKALAGSIEGASAKEIRDRILEDVKSFSGKSPQYDDMTVVVVTMK